MPTSRKTKRPYYKKKRTNWNKTKQAVNARAGRSIVPYVSPRPKTMLVKMRFTLASGLGKLITSTSGILHDYPYRANDCFDPYALAGGSQPRGFDEYIALYRNGVVVKSKLHVNFFHNESSTTNNPMVVGISMSDSATAFGTTTQADQMERARTQWKMLTCYDPPKRFSMTYTPKSFFGTQDVQDENRLWFTNAASPTEQCGFHIWGYSPNSNTQTCRAIGYIDYTVLLIHPTIPPQS